VQSQNGDGEENMMTERTEVDKLHQEVYALRQEVEALRRVVREQVAAYTYEAVSVAPTVPRRSPDTEHVLAALQGMGLLVEPRPGSFRLSDEWERMSNEERETARGQLYAAKLDLPLSQILIANRRRWES